MSLYLKIFKETLFYSFSKAIGGIFGLASIILFMRIVGPDIYGQYSFILSQCNLIVALGLGWLNQAKLRYYTIDSISSNYISNQKKALSYSIIFCLLFISFLVIYQSMPNQVWLVSVITIIAISCFNYLKIFYQVRIMPKKIMFLTSIQSFFGLSMPITVMYFFGYNEILLLFGFAISFFMAIIILLKGQLKTIFFSYEKKITEKSNEMIKKWFSFGAPLSIWFAVSLSLSFLDRYYINYYLSNDELGMYAGLQELLTRSFSLTLFPFTMALHPRIMKLWNTSKLNEAIKLIMKSITTIFCLGILIILIAWIYNDLIFIGIQTVIPVFNNESKSLIIPLLSAGFLWQLSLLTHKMLELNEQTKLMIFAIIPSLIINVIGNKLFLPHFGGIATAYTAFFSALIYFFITSIHCVYSIYKVKTS